MNMADDDVCMCVCVCVDTWKNIPQAPHPEYRTADLEQMQSVLDLLRYSQFK